MCVVCVCVCACVCACVCVCVCVCVRVLDAAHMRLTHFVDILKSHSFIAIVYGKFGSEIYSHSRRQIYERAFYSLYTVNLGAS